MRRRVRRCVRAHRRDRAWLIRTLRVVAASAGFALTLIGAQASAQSIAVYDLRSGANDPIPTSVSEYRVVPGFADLDDDGDLDLLSAGDGGDGSYGAAVLRYYENTGTATAPAYTERIGPSNPFDGLGSGFYNLAPAFGDLDGDGDLDVVSGEYYGTLQYFENIGTASAPSFVLRTGASNPLDGEKVSQAPGGPGGMIPGSDLYSVPTLGDLDGDGDLDLIAGAHFSQVDYWENTGTTNSPVFVKQVGPSSPINGLSNGLFPMLVDLDSDGDLDLASGVDMSAYGAGPSYFENTGTPNAPTFVERTGPTNPFSPSVVTGHKSFGDTDGDGDLDLTVGDGLFFSNLIGLEMIERTSSENPFDGQDLGDNSTPVIGDSDSDGDFDVTVGDALGNLFALRNTGTAINASFSNLGGTPLLLANPASTFGDLDGDGDGDLLIGLGTGGFLYARNTGNADTLAYNTAVPQPLAGQDVGGFATPTFGDLDRDGDLDVFAGANDGTFRFFENTGTPLVPAFTEQTGANNPLDGQDVGSYSTPTFADFDRDGDLDVFAGEDDGTIRYFENTGDATSPAFVERVAENNPLSFIDVGSRSAPAFRDFDGDGDPDLLCGKSDGTLSYFENLAPVRSEVATVRLGDPLAPPNPLAGLDVGDNAVPAFGDTGGDGDLDIGLADATGNIAEYENIGLATAADFSFVALTPTGFTYPAPTYRDLDGDRDTDLVLGVSLGTFGYAENIGDIAGGIYDILVPNPLLGESVGSDSTPTLGDIDRDGDLDMLAGATSGAFYFFENTGTTLAPAFTEQIGAGNPLDGEDIGAYSAPVFVDFDRDGDLDLVSGNDGGPLSFFENIGTAIAPTFVERTGPDNPLGAYSFTGRIAPIAFDINADGYEDLVIGKADGTADVILVPEPGFATSVGLGVWCLGLVARIRRQLSVRSRSA